MTKDSLNPQNIHIPKDYYNAEYRIKTGPRYPEDTNIAHKNRSPVFFQNTRVDSCNHVTMKNGRPMAIPFKPNYPTYATGPRPNKMRDQIQVPIQSKRDQVNYNMKKSAYSDQYRLQRNASAGCFQKPLTRYDSNLPRSRLPNLAMSMGSPYEDGVEIGDLRGIYIFNNFQVKKT